MKKILIVLSLSLIALVTDAQLLNENANLEHANVSYLVINAETGAELLSYRANQSMIPASVLKIVPTASALLKFGKDAVFETKLFTSGELTNGVLNGNVYILGGGDPALGSLNYQEHYYQPVSFIQNWVIQIKNAGIKRIQGDVIAIEPELLMQKVPRTWLWEDISNHFGASPGQLNVYDNFYQLRFNTMGAVGDIAKIASVVPDDIGLEFESQVKIADGGGDQAYVFGGPDSEKRLILGTLPAGYNSFVVKAAIPDPAKLLAKHFHQHLVAAGVPVSGSFYTETFLPQETDLLLKTASPKLERLIHTTNHRSINLYANMIGSLFAADSNIKSASDDIIRFWEKKGMNTDGFILEDLCGLSPFNQISAEQIGFILKTMHDSEMNETFKNSLPVSGKSGTLRYFGHNKGFHGKFHGKSGSIKRVYAYSGYLTTKSGKTLIVAGFVNQFSCSSKEAKNALADFFDTVYDDY
ncbi:MAG: D-alanyl-D-alanine carboxypeptidase/D-alanyl-D-alanine-endopeptidase [Bacteroidales bacterium]|nr:D-alanyl-D-alanine carboxypeptidase/D-alanyl-D-alanine-endopeptidase [Bacteroidales bacterium]